MRFEDSFSSQGPNRWIRSGLFCFFYATFVITLEPVYLETSEFNLWVELAESVIIITEVLVCIPLFLIIDVNFILGKIESPAFY